MSGATPEYVVRTPQGSWRIAGTRVSLDSVVHAYWDGQLPEAMVTDFPTLTLEHVHGAIAFYLRHRQQIDSYPAEQVSRWQQFREDMLHNIILQRESL